MSILDLKICLLGNGKGWITYFILPIKMDLNYS